MRSKTRKIAIKITRSVRFNMPGFSANDRVDDEVLEGTSVINGVPLAISAIPV